MSATLWVNGEPADRWADYSALTWETCRMGGMGGASWTWGLGPDFVTKRFGVGAYVEFKLAGRRVWHGRWQNWDRKTDGDIARGIWDDGRTIPALDGSGNVTRDIAVALATATGSTYGWRVKTGLTGTVVGDGSDGPVSVVDLLEQQAKATARAAGVRADGRLYMSADPTSPRWFIDAGDIPLSDTDIGVVNRLAGRYRTSTGTYATERSTTAAAAPIVEETVDITSFGVLSAAQARDVLNQMLAIMGQRPSWSGSMTIHRSQITNFGGAEYIALENILGGHMVHLQSLSAGVRSQLGGMTSLDVVLDKATYTDGSDQIVLEAVGTQPTTHADAMRKVKLR